MEIWRFSQVGLDPSDLISGSYDPRLVFLSFVIATAAGYATLELVGRVRATPARTTRLVWMAAGALCMGCGVWAMHFVGMLSYLLPLPMHYDLRLTIASAVPAVVGSGAAVHVLGSDQIGARRVALGGLLMGLGIGVMHYTGMEAMRLSADLRYDPTLFLLSVLVAYGLSALAFWAEFKVSRRGGEGRILALASGAPILGVAVCGMHYTAMRSTLLYAQPLSADDAGMLVSPFTLSVAILVVTTLVVILVAAGTFVDRRLQRALTDLRRLEGLLPMCAWCKKITTDDGTWYTLEAYVSRQSKSTFTHGICPTCSETVFGEVPGT